ncbi:hypothetical protein [Streptomyces sp. 1331.2]|uniref:hypothetical protein n=1 Tax=Streptomyces sp. 1331.2 TaxID=1938835 RepID=UPI000BCB7C6D|nr:hypothetical protein [Streptomyces sp. 1331.2]SOB83775.1 hypothetical protein SAMN06272789_3989 [Streptomyces sp. 1331.2]
MGDGLRWLVDCDDWRYGIVFARGITPQELARRLGGVPGSDDGHFLHHVPAVEYKNDGTVLRTAQLIAADGWDLDLPLWADAAKCSPCHPGNDSH